MIQWFRDFSRASRNLAHVVRRNPVWAVQAVITSPLALLRHLFGVVVLFLIASLVLGLGAPLLLDLLRIGHNSILGNLLMVPILLLILLVPLRALFQPMILRYGYADEADTHGSARFATDAEARDIMGDAGLLIGRDRKSGKLLRYPGPAHLLTIAPIER